MYVITKSTWGGAGRYVYDLATCLSPDIYDITVLAGGEGLLIDKLNEKGIKTITIPDLGRDIKIFDEFKVAKTLKTMFEELAPDMVHLNSSKVGGIGAFAGRLAKIPKIIYTAHGWAFNEDRSFIKRLLMYLASWATVLLSHRVITISYKEEAQALQFLFVSNKKISMVYIGSKDKTYLEREEARKYIQGVNKKTPGPGSLWIGSIGELHTNKGHIKALEMCKILKNHKKDFFYMIIGEGEERRNLEEYILDNKLSDNVALLGSIPDPTSGSTLVKAFDVFLFPSKKEGLPYVLLEAAKAGMMVISTRVGGIPEIITHQESGLLATDIEGEVFANFVESVMYDERIRMDFANNLMQSVNSKFPLSVMIDETERVYLN